MLVDVLFDVWLTVNVALLVALASPVVMLFVEPDVLVPALVFPEVAPPPAPPVAVEDAAAEVSPSAVEPPPPEALPPLALDDEPWPAPLDWLVLLLAVLLPLLAEAC